MVPEFQDATREELLAHLNHLMIENQQLLAEVEYFRQRSLALVRLGNPEQENEALLEGYRKYRHFFEKGASLNMVVNTGGLFEDVNESFLRCFGYPREEVIGRPVMDLIAPEQRERVGQYIMNEFGGKPSGQIMIDGIARDGSRRTVLSSSEHPAATIFKSGQPVRMFVAFMDITKRREAERELERQSEALTRARAKLEELGRLLCICPTCSRVRQGEGEWQQLESLLRDLSGHQFQRSLCPDCADARELDMPPASAPAAAFDASGGSGES